MKFNQIWCVSYWHEWGVHRQFFFAPPRGALGRGQKVKYHLISITKSFLYQTLCLFSQMKDTKHIRQDFNSVALVMPKGPDFGALRVLRGSKNFFQTWSCGISNRRGWQAEQNACKFFILGSNWWPWGEVKRSYIIKFRLTCQFQRFFYQTLCVLCKWNIQNISEGIFILSPWSCPRGETLGRWGCPGGQKIFFFQTWSCGISNRRG